MFLPLLSNNTHLIFEHMLACQKDGERGHGGAKGTKDKAKRARTFYLKSSGGPLDLLFSFIKAPDIWEMYKSEILI